jgi:hypothetical protein
LKRIPKSKVALAGSIVTDGDGQYICHRHALVRIRNTFGSVSPCSPVRCSSAVGSFTSGH